MTYKVDAGGRNAVNAEVDLASLRRSYEKGALDLGDLAADPLKQLRGWLDDAKAAEVLEPNAMTLATASADGKPSARVVLLKGLDERGLTFYTNYESRKGREIAGNPNVALVFNWLGLERQARFEGTAARLPYAESEAYHQTRPRGSQLGEWASPQSRVVRSREVLEANLQAAEARFPGEVPLPEFWGGFVVRPERAEFWQGRPNRLHDRFRYTRGAEGWTVERLAP